MFWLLLWGPRPIPILCCCSMRSAHRKNDIFPLFWSQILLWNIFFAHVTFVVLSNSIKQTISKSANNFSSYKGTNIHTNKQTYLHYCFIKGRDLRWTVNVNSTIDTTGQWYPLRWWFELCYLYIYFIWCMSCIAR